MTPAQRLDDIAERVATARTRWLLGQRAEARRLLAEAQTDYVRFQHVLRATAGVLALEHSMAVAEAAMTACALRDTVKEANRVRATRG